MGRGEVQAQTGRWSPPAGLIYKRRRDQDREVGRASATSLPVYPRAEKRQVEVLHSVLCWVCVPVTSNNSHQLAGTVHWVSCLISQSSQTKVK